MNFKSKIRFVVWLLVFIKENVLVNSTSDKYFHKIQPSASLETQQNAAQNVVKRIIPKYFHRFTIQIDFKMMENSFQIKSHNGTNVIIRGSSGVAACKGFYHYLKYYLRGHVSWSGYQLNHIPDKFPPCMITHISPNKFVYYQNVCTWSYSFVWWTWQNWQRHIDWMALMGINLSIAPIQEVIWAKVYRKLGLFDNEIEEHFAGAAFSAWQRMGNIRGWGGPLSNTFIQKQFKLQKQIIKAQRDLGMFVALPAFSGHVPKAFKRIFPNTTFTPVSRWNRFEDRYCCPLFINLSDNVFRAVSKLFLNEIIQQYGTDHIYFADPFNEILPKQFDVHYLSNVSMNIYQAMRGIDPKAIWLMQGWMFVKNPLWTDKYIRAYLTAVPLGKLLVLDLQSEQSPQYNRTQSYYGQPFIWNMLHNFGGTLGMHGSVNIVNERIKEAREMPNSTMIGVGVTPEGIHQNYPLYEFTLERGWNNSKFYPIEWFDYYSIVRYGIEDKGLKSAWKLLLNSVYDYTGSITLHGKYIICRRPNIKLSPWTWYNPVIVKTAWKMMLNSSEYIDSNDLFEYDLVDLTRQFLQNCGDKIYLNIISEYKKRNLTMFTQWGKTMIDLLNDMEKILKTNRHFMLGPWLNAAKNQSSTETESISFEYNAKTQITTWGPNGEIVDYANKQWSGMFQDLFIPRWKMFLTTLHNCLTTKKTFNEKIFNNEVLKRVEIPFTLSRKIYPTDSKGNTVITARKIYTKWCKIF